MIDYTIYLEVQPQEIEPDNWQMVVAIPAQLDRLIKESDVDHLKAQVASQVVFQKLPARLRITWADPQATGKVGGKKQNRERELLMYNDFTFQSAQQFLITSLEQAIEKVRNEQPRHTAVPA